MNCNKCEDKVCKCASGSIPVMPPSACNTPECPDPAPCPEVIPTACIQYVGSQKLCGEDVVYEEGDTIGVIEGKIVDYFCERLSTISESVVDRTTIVTEVSCGLDVIYETGDTIIEALEKTADYYCSQIVAINDVIGGLATVATSGAYSDLTGVPTVLSDFTNDILTVDELAAINGANTPTALNVFATISDVPTALSQLSNDTGFITSFINLYNGDDALTGNRTVTGGGFSLTFNAKTKVRSYGTTVYDIGFSVSNFNNTRDFFAVDGAGNVYSNGKNNAIDDCVYGYRAGSSMGVSAYFNTFFGSYSGQNVTGAGCVAIGRAAMQGDSTFSTAIGSQALVNGGSYMVAIGSNASRVAGNSFGVVIGTDAAYVLANGQKNIIIGWSSAASMTTGSNNIILGNYNNANPSTLVTGNKNTLIGDEQWDFPATMEGSVVLGYKAKATGNNQFSVGSTEENAGAVTTEGFTQALTWTVKINGVDYKIPLQLA